VAPAARVAALVDELSAILRRDTARVAIPAAQRRQLADALSPPIGDSESRDGAAAQLDSLGITPPAAALDAHIRFRIDSVIRTAYPGLVTRSDETPALVGVIFDKGGNVTRHASRIGNVTGDADVLLMSLGIDTLSARTTSLGLFSLKQWHTHVIFAAEDTGPPMGPPRYRGGIGRGGFAMPLSRPRDRSPE
jgi:hypothetical protein